MHQPQRGQPAVVPAQLAAGTSDAAPADASTGATVPPNPLPLPPSFSPDALAPFRTSSLPACCRTACRACAKKVPEQPATRPGAPAPHRCLDEGPARGVGKGGGPQSRLTLHPTRPHVIAHVVCVFVALRAWCCVCACVRVPSQTPLTLSHPMLCPSIRASGQPPSCCPVLQYLSWRPSGRRVERCKHFSGPRQPMQVLRQQARP